MYGLTYLMGHDSNPLLGGEQYSNVTDTTEVDTLKQSIADLQKTFQDKVREISNMDWLCADYRRSCDSGQKSACNDADAYCARLAALPEEIKKTQATLDSKRAQLAIALANLQSQADANTSTEDRIKEQQAVTTNKIRWYVTVGSVVLLITAGIIGGRYLIKKGMA